MLHFFSPKRHIKLNFLFLESSYKSKLSEVAAQLCAGRRCSPLLKPEADFCFCRCRPRPHTLSPAGQFSSRKLEKWLTYVSLSMEMKVRWVSQHDGAGWSSSSLNDVFGCFRENGKTDLQMITSLYLCPSLDFNYAESSSLQVAPPLKNTLLTLLPCPWGVSFFHMIRDIQHGRLHVISSPSFQQDPACVRAEYLQFWYAEP